MTVAPERRIPLFKDTFQEGSWESSDVALEYQYVIKTGVIQLSVTGKSKHWYEHLAVRVKLVDAEGKILETKTIYNSRYQLPTSLIRSRWLPYRPITNGGRFKGCADSTTGTIGAGP